MVKNSLRKEYIGATYCHPSYSISMQSTSHKILGWMKSQAGIKIPGRNINNLRYTDDITLRAESEEELKRLLMRMKEESEKASLKLNIKKTENSDSGIQLHYCMTKRRGKRGNSDRYPLLSLQNHCGQWPHPWNQKTITFLAGKQWQT